MARLPTVGSDSGNWGLILNEFLGVSITSDGKLKLETWANAAARPATPTTLQIGFNIATGNIEQYSGTTWSNLLALTKSDVGLSNVDNTSDATKNTATVTLTNKSITRPAVTNPAEAQQTLTDGANIDWDMDNGGIAKVTLGGNRVMNAPTHLRNGATYILEVIQDATGSRTITSWNAVFVWSNATAPTLTTTATRRDFISFVCSNNKLYGTAVLNFV